MNLDGLDGGGCGAVDSDLEDLEDLEWRVALVCCGVSKNHLSDKRR